MGQVRIGFYNIQLWNLIVKTRHIYLPVLETLAHCTNEWHHHWFFPKDWEDSFAQTYYQVIFVFFHNWCTLIKGKYSMNEVFRKGTRDIKCLKLGFLGVKLKLGAPVNIIDWWSALRRCEMRKVGCTGENAKQKCDLGCIVTLTWYHKK